MKKKLNIWIFFAVVCIFLNLIVVSNLLFLKIKIISRFAFIESFEIAFWPVWILIFVLSFLLASRGIKKKQNIIWLLLLFALIFVYPSMMRFRKILGEEAIVLFTIYVCIMFLMAVSCAIALYLGYDWFNKQKRTQELERQNLQSELKLLKNQVNPHFLFNTLNNIDRLIVSNPDKASTMLLGLSGMMRYMIYDTNSNNSPLSQELQQINNYIDLQKMQYANPDLVEYSVKGNYENINVAPMLFIPFIENAFKHCTDKTVKNAIQFSFKIEEKIIYFESNNISNPAQHIEKDSTGGIGLETVKRRLELLYPNKHQLQIDEKNNIFAVSLALDTQ
jgi:LytS/YehU family sensor histidine kinase